MPTVSWLATLVATAFSFVLGGLWYGPLFGQPWMEENGFTPEQIRQNFNPALNYGATFVLALVASLVFGIVIGPSRGVAFATGTGALVGAFWVAGSIATNDLFERRTVRHFLINGGYHIVRFTLIGLAFGLLG
jgi:hypothetical protein